MIQNKTWLVLIFVLSISGIVHSQNEYDFDCKSSAKINPELVIIAEAYITASSPNYDDYIKQDYTSLTAEAFTLDRGFSALFTKKAHYLQDSIFVKDYFNNPGHFWVNQDFVVRDWYENVETNSLCKSNSNYEIIITRIQDSLFYNGYPETPYSGRMCDLTYSNLMLFQIQNGLPVGNLNEETVSLLLDEKTSKSYEYNYPWAKGSINCKFKFVQVVKKSRTEVIEEQCLCPSNKNLDRIQTQIETKLCEMYYEVDGKYGVVTKRSLAEFQLRNNRPIGFYDLITLDLLGINYK